MFNSHRRQKVFLELFASAILEMSLARGSGVSAGTNSPRITYIATRNYTNDFFSYTTNMVNLEVQGSLGPVTGATDLLCAEGNFLHETGHRLYRGANPGISTLMVGVFDFSSGLRGFIDPNSTAFITQNEDRPYYVDNAGYSPNTSDPFNRNDQANPVYTRGNIYAEGSAYIGQNISTIGNATIQGNVSTSSSLSAGAKLFASAITGTVAFNPSDAGWSTIGGFAKQYFYNSSITANSRIFITPITLINQSTTSVENVSPSTFRLVTNNNQGNASADRSVYNYFIIN